MTTRSLWIEVELPRFPALSNSGSYDVIIIGAGLTGLTAAYLLSKEGKKVCVLERDRICAGDTCHTTAHITYVTDTRITELTNRFGRDKARLFWEAGKFAIDAIENIVRQESIDCNFSRVPGFLHSPFEGKYDDKLKDEADLAGDLGFEARYFENIPNLNRCGVRFENQARFHPLAYLKALSERIVENGGQIFENSEATEITGEPFKLVINGKHLQSDHLIIATHKPLTGKAGFLKTAFFQSKLAAYSSYVIEGKIAPCALQEGIYSDTHDPYYYLRIDKTPQYDEIIFGGLDHKTGQESDTQNHFRNLENYLRRFMPNVQIERRWSGQVIETPDGLPYIGEAEERQFVATGYAGNGMTLGTVAACMARDNVLNRPNPWKDLFAVQRKKISAATEYIKENVDYPYYMLSDRISSQELISLKPGEGKVIKHDGKRIACCMDKDGNISQVSAVCPHMGCIVHWNGAEETWDCPCHGSRFHPDGRILAGPAESPLPEVEISLPYHGYEGPLQSTETTPGTKPSLSK